MGIKIHLTKREEELMNFLWDHGEPVTSKDIQELYVAHTWSPSYLLVMLKSLEKKGAIEQCGSVQYGTQYARKFRTCLSREDYYVQTVMDRGIKQDELMRIAVAAAKKVDPKEKEALVQALESIIKDLENRGRE